MGVILPQTVRTVAGAVCLRCGLEADAPAFVEHRLNIATTSPHNVTTVDELDTDVEKIREWVADHTAKPGWLLLVVVPEEAPAGGGPPRILGALSFRCANRRRVQHHGEFGISVVDDWRGRGLGRAMIEALIAWGTAHEFVEKIYLGVFVTNRGARRLYHSLGFRKEAVRRSYFRMDDGTYIDDILMSRWVKPPPSDDQSACESAAEAASE